MESDYGAKASAMIYSIVETAKANKINTYKHLELLLTEIPKHMSDKDLRSLMIFFRGLLWYRRNVQVNIKNLKPCRNAGSP